MTNTHVLTFFAVLLLGGTTAFAQAPSAPTLLLPASDATDVPLLATFQWSASTGATSYDLQVSTNQLFLTTVVSVTGISDTLYTLTTALGSSTTYYWRARAVNESEASGWSPGFGGRAFTTVPPIPAAPALLTPADNATDLKTLPTFTWNASDGATSYGIEVAADENFNSVVLSEQGIVGTSFTSTAAFAINTMYYWRVQATNAGGTSDWSGAWRFTTYPTVPPAPVLVYPADAATGISTKPAFSWEVTPGADTYALQVAEDSLFAAIVLDQSGIGEAMFTPDAPLDSAQRYFWRVLAANSGGNGAWAAVRSFTVTGSPPDITILLTPSDGATDVWVDAVLTWENNPGADTYTVQISTDPAFGSTLVDANGIVGTSYSAPGLARNTTHYWRVNGSNALGTGPWSATWSFVTVPEVPSAPVLQSPVNNATEVPNPPTMQWRQADRAVTYELQISFRDDFQGDTLDFEQVGITDTTFTLPSRLAGGSVYNWRVRAVNPGGAGEWSGIWKFTTKLEAPLPIRLYAPENGEVGLSTSVLIGWWASTDNPAETYRLQVSVDSLFGLLAVDIAGITATERFVSGLANSETYYWRVNGTNRVGTGPWSEVWHFSTRAGSPRAPTATTPAPGDTNVSRTPTFTWTPGGGEESFELQAALTSDFESPVINATGILDTTYTAQTTLAGGTLHYWRVRARNASGTSSWTATRSFTTIPPPPDAPVMLAPANGATEVDTFATFLWHPSVWASTYALQVAVDTLFDTVVVSQSGLTDTTLTLTSHLLRRKKYFWRVNATSIGGTGVWATSWSFRTNAPPNTPPVAMSVSVTGTPQVGETLTGSYTYLDADEDPEATSLFRWYRDTVAIEGAESLTYVPVMQDSGAMLYFQVTPVAAAGLSPGDSVRSPGVGPVLPTAPSPPLTIAASLVTDTSFTASWTAPSGATGYLLDVSVDTFKTYVTGFESFPVTETSQHVGGLATNVLHFYRVRATGPGGTSGYSDTATVVTTFHPSDRPVALEADSITQTQFRARWRPAAGATGYRLDVATDSLFADLLPSYADMSVVDTTQVVSGLTAGTQYYYRVRGTNESGASQNSDTIAVITVPPTPVPLAATDITSLSFRAVWSNSKGAQEYRLDVSRDTLFTDLVAGYQDLIVGDTTQVVLGLAPRTSYYYRVRAAAGGVASPSSERILVTTSSVVSVTIFLEGGYRSDDSMSTALAQGGHIPLTQPYSGAPWEYAGQESMDSISTDVVDWILLEFRLDSSAGSLHSRRAALLRRNGAVSDTNGSVQISIPGVAPESLYVVVRHRCHVPIMSALPVVLTVPDPMIDFTSAMSSAFGSAPMKLVGTRHCMVAGDANGNGQVATSDINGVIRPSLGLAGYRNGDINLNGQVANSDMNSYTRPNLGRGTQVP